MATLRILDGTGHTAITYDPTSLEEDQQAAVRAAEELFNEARKNGATGFRTNVSPAIRIDKFDPAVDEITMVPRVAGGC